MATKYLEIFNEMVTKHEKAFDTFQELHDKYEKDPQKGKVNLTAKVQK